MRFLRPASLTFGFVVLILILVVGILGGWTLGRTFSSLGADPKTRIDQSVVVERVHAVAKLVSSEAYVRDVVFYENTWMGSTKRSLVIATGKALVGFDLEPPPKIEIDDRLRRVRIRLPRARLLGIDIEELKTYDEKQGLWNLFHPTDRDSIFQLAREQLAASSQDLGVLNLAEESAAQLMQTLFARDDYSVEVSFSERNLRN